MIKDSKKRYREEYDEGSQLLWPSDLEDSVTRKFYRDLSHLSKNLNHKKIKTNLFMQLIKILTGKGGSPISR